MANTKITTNVIADGAITSAKLDTNITISGDITGTLATAAQPNITSLGTLTGLNVSGTPTFDGLTVDGSGNISGNTYVNSGNGTGTALKVGGESGSGIKTQYVFSGSTQHNWQLGFATHASQVMSITPSSSAGNTTFTTPILNLDGANSRVGIGTSSPDEILHVNAADSGNSLVAFTNSTTGLTTEFVVGINASEQAIIYNENNTDMIFATNDDEKMRIDSSGNVTVTGKGSFTDNGTDDPQIQMFRGKATRPAYTFTENNTTGMFKPADNNLSFSTNGIERMRIDSSGNLLVGTTDVDLGYTDGDSGVALKPDGPIQAARDSAYSILYLNKLNNNGPLIDFHKDGVIVGSIGVIHNNNLFIGAPSHSGLQFGTSVVYPTGGSTGDANDATVDIGASGQRFKNLYLSGTSYITANNTSLAADFTNSNAAGFGLRVTTHATGSQYGLAVDSYGGGYSRDFTVGVDGNVNVLTGNLVIGTAGKGIDFSATSGSGTSELLDDYEEGTWTPSIASGTANFAGAAYTKVGRFVTCQFIVDTFSERTSANAVLIGNLPFAAEATNRPTTLGCLGAYISSSFGSVTGGYLDSTTTLRLYNTSDSTFRSLKHSDLTSGGGTTLYIAFSYMAA